MSVVENVKHPSDTTNHLMLLQIGENISKYSDYYILKTDSLSDEYALQKMDEIEALNRLVPIQLKSLSLNILKDFPKGKVSTYDYIPMSGLYYYVEEKNRPAWKFESGNAVFCGYNCKKAAVTLYGRNYTAWYTHEIPISDGPWKFWGLPGLILKITDDKNEYDFECIGIEKPRWTDAIYLNQQDCFPITKKRFNESVRKYYENPSALFESREVKVDGKTPEKIKSRPYNPIELSE